MFRLSERFKALKTNFIIVIVIARNTKCFTKEEKTTLKKAIGEFCQCAQVPRRHDAYQ